MANRHGPTGDTLRELLRRGDSVADEDTLSPAEVRQMQLRIAAEAREAPVRNVRSAWVLALVPALAGALLVVVAVIAWRTLSGAGHGQAGRPAPAASTPLVAYRLPASTAGLSFVPPGAAAVPQSAAVAARASRGAATSIAQGFSPASGAVQPAAAVRRSSGAASRSAQPAAAAGQAFSPDSEGARPRQLQFVTAGGTRIVWVLNSRVTF